MLQFKNWLLESTEMKTRLVVYDFDGTIAIVPERPHSWEGSDWWGHQDSLSHPHYDGSVNHEVVEAFRRDQADAKTDVILLTGRRGIIAPAVRRVLKAQDLHGRRIIPTSNTKALERYRQSLSNGDDEEHPNEPSGHTQYYSGDHSTESDYPRTAKGKADGSTLVHKIYIVQKKVTPYTEVVEFWDDRADHAPHFIKLGLDLLRQYGAVHGGRLQNVIFHRVFAPAYVGGQAVVKHIPIKPGMTY